MSAKITRRELHRARNALRKRAGDNFPDLRSIDHSGPSIEAAFKTLSADANLVARFVRDTVKHNDRRLRAVYGIMTEKQLNVVRAAMLYGVALGIQIERERADSPFDVEEEE